MSGFDFGKEVSRALLAAVVAFIVGQFLKALGAGKWVVGAGGGAAGGVVAVAAIA